MCFIITFKTYVTHQQNKVEREGNGRNCIGVHVQGKCHSSSSFSDEPATCVLCNWELGQGEQKNRCFCGQGAEWINT